MVAAIRRAIEEKDTLGGIIEVAALNQRLKDFGIHSAKMLEEQLRSALQSTAAGGA